MGRRCRTRRSGVLRDRRPGRARDHGAGARRAGDRDEQGGDPGAGGEEGVALEARGRPSPRSRRRADRGGGEQEELADRRRCARRRGGDRRRGAARRVGLQSAGAATSDLANVKMTTGTCPPFDMRPDGRLRHPQIRPVGEVDPREHGRVAPRRRGRGSRSSQAWPWPPRRHASSGTAPTIAPPSRTAPGVEAAVGGRAARLLRRRAGRAPQSVPRAAAAASSTPPGGACPAVCNGGCPEAGVCEINCTSAGLRGQHDPRMPRRVSLATSSAWAVAKMPPIQCPDTYPCSVSSAWTSSSPGCQGMIVKVLGDWGVRYIKSVVPGTACQGATRPMRRRRLLGDLHAGSERADRRLRQAPATA